ncbi:hypothetical protein A3SI_16687, partial [Nitritalea halalkaliphila LW7]
NLAYTITVTNNGPSDAQEVVVTDPIPVGTSFVSADMGGMLENGIVTWNVGTIPAGETVTLSLVVLVDANLADGTIISNIARVESPTDPDTPKESDPDETPVDNNQMAMLEIEKMAPATIEAGQELVYTITVRNTGTGAARNVVVTDPVPVAATFVSADNGGMLANGLVTWTIAALQPGEAITLQLIVRVGDQIAPGSVIINVATAETPDDPNTPISSDPVRTEVVEPRVAEIEVEKTLLETSVTNGDMVTFEIRVRSVGNADALNLVVTDQLPASVMFIDATGDLLWMVTY